MMRVMRVMRVLLELRKAPEEEGGLPFFNSCLVDRAVGEKVAALGVVDVVS